MNKFIKKFYIVGIVTFILITINLIFEYKFFNDTIKMQLHKNLSLNREYITSLINKELTKKGQVIEDTSYYLEFATENKDILGYLKKIKEKEPEFISIFFGTTDNVMIDSGEWSPPETYDLRTRPWYTKALQQNDLVFTDGFVNANLNEDPNVIMIAKSVYNEKNELLGVISGAISIKSIFNMISEQKISENSYSFMIDGEGNLLAHPNYQYNIGTEFINVKDISPEFDKIISQNKEGFVPLTLDDKEGYVVYQSIKDTNWIIGNFIPSNDYQNLNQYLTFNFLKIMIFIFIILICFFIYQRKQFIKPLMLLNDDIKKISIETNIVYRLPESKKSEFKYIRNSINHALEKSEEFFKELKNHQEELAASNEELSATLQQLEAYEFELERQFEEIIESKKALEISEKRNRDIINVIPDMIFLYNDEGEFLDYSVCDGTELFTQKENFLGRKITEVMPDNVGIMGLDSIQKALRTGEIQIFEYDLSINNETKYYEARMIKSSENQVLAISRDISEQKNSQFHIDYLIHHDHLTKLYNRRFLDECIQKLDNESNLPIGALMIDVNGLKMTNDAFGHFIGDELLIRVANVLTRVSKNGSIVARTGGDEFIILVFKTSSQIVSEIAKKIYFEMNKEKINNLPISVSVGWEVKNSVEQSINQVISKAEDNMYREKLTESQSMRNKVVQVIIKTLNEKNEREKRHSEEVSKLSKQIGQAMNLDTQMIKEIETAGLLHDIGKITISEELLNKTGKLTKNEYKQIKKHPESGYQILKSVDQYSSLAEYVLSHHERWDGNGYPRGIKGENIPLVSRIICIADAYEAMIADRPYRKGISQEKAIEELKLNSGTQFDPKIVDIFINSL